MNTWRSSFWGLVGILRDHFNPRIAAPGEGKHIRGRQLPHDYRRKLQAKRKAQRQHRRRVQLQAKGRKHHFKS